jgi:hypothetical protein
LSLIGLFGRSEMTWFLMMISGLFGNILIKLFLYSYFLTDPRYFYHLETDVCGYLAPLLKAP